MDDQIKYYYINMNTRTFVNSAEKLVEQTSKRSSISTYALPNMSERHTIIAAGNFYFNEEDVLSVFNKLKENSNG